ncbi:TetR/AcrR family transcriptional regulator [Streptomyces aureus]|uniref:TetR/AcrR family transcriptional regulator n=1 Tax=Streptomyces aureus TaxID=193461 RepID=UPI0036386875
MIDVAVRVFAKRGYHAASVDEIAELAGVSKPMVYLYLDSKEGLFLACLCRESARLVAAFQGAARAGGEPEQRLYAGLAAFFGFVAGHRDSWVVLHRQASELSAAIAAAVAEARRAVMAEVAGLVGDGIADSGRGPCSTPRTPISWPTRSSAPRTRSPTGWSATRASRRTGSRCG